jgi:hypothetical protein
LVLQKSLSVQLVSNLSIMAGAPRCVLAQKSPAQTASGSCKALYFAQGDDYHEFEGGSAGLCGIAAQQTLDCIAPGLLQLIRTLSKEQQSLSGNLAQGGCRPAKEKTQTAPHAASRITSKKKIQRAAQTTSRIARRFLPQ